MSKLESALLRLTAYNSGDLASDAGVPDSRALLLVSVVYLVMMLSVPLTSLSMLIWFALYPVIGATVVCGGFGRIFMRSLVFLPIILFIGIFNPILDSAPAMKVGDVMVSRGWITFISLTLRGIFAVQALLILISSKGFNGLCRAMDALKVPAVFTTQLMMVYRYMTVLLQEALDMRRAREARGYGRKTLPVKDWGNFIGQLFLRTIRRSRRIHASMLARGFKGTLPRYCSHAESWTTRDSAFLALWCGVFVVLRFVNLSAFFHF